MHCDCSELVVVRTNEPYIPLFTGNNVCICKLARNNNRLTLLGLGIRT